MVPYEKLSEKVTKKVGGLFWEELAGWEEDERREGRGFEYNQSTSYACMKTE
jgi:hypothetical protein